MPWYFGMFLPFGSSSFEPENVIYLTQKQALSDYVMMILVLRQQYNANHTCVWVQLITFQRYTETLYIPTQQRGVRVLASASEGELNRTNVYMDKCTKVTFSPT